MKWTVRAPRDLEKILRKLPLEVARLFEVLLTDLENEGPYPKGWHVQPLSGVWKGYLKAKLKREYRVIYCYESKTITIFIEKVAHRKDAYGR